MSINVDYYEKLDSWFELFKDSRHLSISEAKSIAKKIKASSSEKEKEKLQEELLSGTIVEVYKFIKDNGLLMLCDTGFVEFDDLISSLTLAWVDDLDKRLLEVGRYSTLFSRDYFESVAEKLGVEDLADILKIRECGYLGALASYYRDRDNDNELSSYIDWTFSSDCKKHEKKKALNIMEKGYQLYKEYSFINSDNTALLGLYGMIFTSVVVKDGRYGRDETLEFEGDVVRRVDVEKIILENRRLGDSEREVLVDRYGIDGKGEKTFEGMAENYTVGACRLGQIVAKSLRKLRCDPEVRKYNAN